MADIKKYSLIEKLKSADDELDRSPSLLGMTMLTYPNYINAMRSTMFTGHLKQFLNLLQPQFPLVFTNNENTVGNQSNGYYKAPNDMVVYKRVNKFENLTDKPFVYSLFLYDTVKEEYDVKERKVCEDLTENFGFEYDNRVIDSVQEGDEIKAGTTLFKSTSYDDDMNYGYGRNVVVAYTSDPSTSEDAAIASRTFCKDMTTIETETIKFGLNDNQYMLDLYGDGDHYKPLPDLGEFVSDRLCVIRRKLNRQVLYDFKESSLHEVHEGDEIIYIDDNSRIIDYTIYNNSENNYDNSFYKQINKIYKSQTKYYKEIIKTCEEIIRSGKKYTQNVDYIYKRAKEMVDTEMKWRDGDNEFSNLKIFVTYERPVELTKGCKVVGRFGNKGVVSEIREDDEMPYTQDGRRVDLMFNLLAIINRTTSFLLYEMFINDCSYKLRQRMKELPTLEEKEAVLFDYVSILNKEQADKFYRDYKKKGKKYKEEYIQDAIDNGILIHQVPMWEDKAIFYKCQELWRKYNFGYDKLFVKKWGRTYPILTNYIVGEMYIMKLKQSDRRGFSARSTGALDNKSLPTRSFKSKSHTERTSSSCIRFKQSLNLYMVTYSTNSVNCWELLPGQSATKPLYRGRFNDYRKGSLREILK